MDKGFTLAETLITLGIIGIIAAIVMPSLIQKHTNRVVETRLEKFYSIMNQAVMLSETENGSRTEWYDRNAAGLDENNQSKSLGWYNKYLGKYIKTVKITTDSQGRITCFLADGSSFQQRLPDIIADWFYFPGSADKCLKRYKNTANATGKCAFMFIFQPVALGKISDWTHHINKGFEPYKYAWDGTETSLYNSSTGGCNDTSQDRNVYCTAIIQYNNWKIPKNYPFKVSY